METFSHLPQQLPGHACACEAVVKTDCELPSSPSGMAGAWGSHGLWGIPAAPARSLGHLIS